MLISGASVCWKIFKAAHQLFWLDTTDVNFSSGILAKYLILCPSRLGIHSTNSRYENHFIYFLNSIGLHYEKQDGH